LKEREFIRDTFGKYVTNDVADVILNKQINLGGEVRLCTILVTDIANYTSISEELSPQEIVTMLNEYFSVHVKVIQDNQGVVNEFIGDSIFALFNVPLDDPAHAENAIKAALEIERISNSHKFGNQQKLATRIGINTGMVVAGNIGSDERMKYTVIGDEVNIAARLEQLNKEHGTQLLIGENTYELAKSKFDFDQIGKFQLKGKEKLIKVFTAKQRKTTPS
jgi:adenylate cyclase